MKYELYGDQQSNITILAIPALGERTEFYRPLAKQLNEFRWIVCELPGHNGYDTKDSSIISYIHKLKHLLDSLTVTKVHLVGASIGATIIQAFYQQYVEVVQSLFLIDGGYEEMILQTIENFEEIKAAVHEFTYGIEGLTPKNYEHFEQYFLGNYILDKGYYRHHCDVASYNALSQEVETINYCLTKQPTIPVNLLLAENSIDEYKGKKIVEYQQRHPLANVQIIRNGHHYLPLTHTEEVTSFLQKFIKKFVSL